MKIEEIIENEDLEALEELKKRGNEIFLTKDYDSALKKYTEAMEFFKSLKCFDVEAKEEKLDDTEPSQVTEDEITLHEDANVNECMSKIYQNAAVCSEKNSDPDSAVEFYKTALKFNSTYEKAIRKLANLHHQLYLEYKSEPTDDENDYFKIEANDKRGANLDHALTCYQRLEELGKITKKEKITLKELKKLVEQRNEQMKEEMMSKLKDLGNMCLKPFGLSTDNFKMQDNGQGGYSLNFQK